MVSRSTLVKGFGENSFALALCSAAQITDLALTMMREDKMFAVRWLRGPAMHTELDLLDEFGAAWQFPWYYGRNWNAFDECINDLEWINADEFLSIILYSDQLLQSAESDSLSVFFRLMSAAKDEWAQPGTEHGGLPRKRKWFRTLFQCEREEFSTFEQRFLPFRNELANLDFF
jgi:hypothetical protein